MKKILNILWLFASVLIIFIITLLMYLTVTEYKPADIEAISVTETGNKIKKTSSLTIMTYNIGYAGLSKDEDFFMDGGRQVRPGNIDIVNKNLDGISDILQDNPADIYLFQEMDRNSKRSYHINQQSYFENKLDIPSVFAYNFNSSYVPYPLPTIGHVESGLATFSEKAITSASRISLPVPFSWPIRTCNLKRCLLETRFQIADTTKELVVYNLHLEAYDSGDGQEAQTKELLSVLEAEYQQGNYVIAGGDFNQLFDSVSNYPLQDSDNWMPGWFKTDTLPQGFKLATDTRYPTCRLLNAPYTGNYNDSQVYVIDGFIVSDNISIEETAVINTDFIYTDHQPVQLKIHLN